MSESQKEINSLVNNLNKNLKNKDYKLNVDDSFSKTDRIKYDYINEKIEADDEWKNFKPKFDIDNIYDIKPCNYSKIFKDDIIVKSDKYPNESIEKFNTNLFSEIRSLSFQYVIDNPEFLMKNHKYIKDLHKYLGDIVENFEKKREINVSKFNLMPTELKIYIDESLSKNFLDQYYVLIDQKKKIILSHYNSMMSTIGEPINNQMNELLEIQNKQLTEYNKNFEYMKNLINTNFIDENNYPDHYKILENLKECSTPKELENKIEFYLKQLNSIDNNNITEFILSLNNLMKKNVTNVPEFKFPEWFEVEIDEMRDFVNSKLAGIKKRLLKDFNNNVIYDFEEKCKKSNFNRNLTNDCTSCFLKFNEYHKFKLRLNKKLGLDNQHKFTCISNIENQFIACGAKNGNIYLYNIKKNKLCNIFSSHDDEVTSLIKFKFKKDGEDPELLLVSGGGQLDKDIYLWKIKEKNPIMKLGSNTSGIVGLVDMLDFKSIISLGFDGLLLLIDVKKEQIVEKLNLNNYPILIRLANNKNKLVIAFADSKISILNFNKNYESLNNDVSILSIEHNFELESMAYNLLSFQINIDKVLITTKQGNCIILDTYLGKYEIKKEKMNLLSDSCLIENGKVAFKEEYFVINTPKNEESFNLLDDENIFKGLIQPNIIPKPKTQLIKLTDAHLQFACININGKIEIFDII